MCCYFYRFFKSLWFIGMVISLSDGFAMGKSSATLSFHDSVIVNDSVIYLSDIAVISCESTALSKDLASMVAGEAAPPGYSRFINTGDLLMYRILPKFQNVDIRTDKKKRISVNTDFVEKRVGDYQDVIQDYIKQHVTWKEGEWKVELKNPETSWKCYNAPVDIKIEGLKSTCPRGQTQLELIANQYGRMIKIPVPSRIYVTVPVLVAQTNIPRGKILDSSDAMLQDIDISDYGPMPCYSAAEAIGKAATRSIAPGTILNTRLLAALPVVTKGDALSIGVEKGSVRIAVAAIARENGSVGQKIWVENAATHKLVRVTIKDKYKAVL
jgi:flagella basal body P-ring formation protein FlgA